MIYEVKVEDETMQALKEKYPDQCCGAKVILVIETVVSMGEGTEEDPYRAVMVYRSLDGELLAVHDPCSNYKN